MDTDLAYCLERFIDDQIELIDQNLETIEQNEAHEYAKIDELMLSENPTTTATTTEATPISQSTHEEDAAIVQRFVSDLLDTVNNDSAASSPNDLKDSLDELRSELTKQIDECMEFIVRIRKLARPILGSTNFVTQCREFTNRLSAEKKSEKNFTDLCQIIETSDFRSVVENIQNWWKETYGSSINEIIHLNKRYNPGINNNDMVILPPRCSIILCAKRIISIRNMESNADSRKHDIVCEFVREIQSIDDINRQEISADDLIVQLDNCDINSAIEFANNWLSKRDAIRDKQKEEEQYEKARREVKAEFNRQRIAQDAKKLALAALLRRLAIGSTNTNQFDEKLKATVDNQKEKGHIPIITGDIREPSALLIPDGNIRITRVESGSVIVIGYVMPPYGKNVIEGLNGNARDSAARIEAVRQSCSSYNGQVESITLGDFGLSIDHKLMDPAWNRKYLWSPEDPEKGEYWKRSLNRGGRPYFCPSEEIALTDLTDLATSPRDEAREASSVSQTMPLVNPLNSVHIYIVKQKRQAFFCLMF
ncbi:unnamed protein product [Rotaria sp. Silwood1]|nr:unnamed protein product [Rotaria sp. Silwood1]CAF1498550.1 unnamed protein product [Rotaria sp. Silwood1]